MTRWETELAAREAGTAAQRWRDHRAGCVACSRAVRTHAENWGCLTGMMLQSAEATARRVLAAHRELDAMPPEDQESLF